MKNVALLELREALKAYKAKAGEMVKYNLMIYYFT